MKSYLEFAMFLHVVHYAVAIKKFSRCPSAVLRGLIANETCPRAPKHYHCLEIVQSKDFLQICIGPERIEEGQYPVFQDSTAKFIFPKTCVSSRYQPRPLFTYERNECLYEKSSCTEEGQIIFSNGSAIDDRTCRCDYTKGYAFISTPVNKYRMLKKSEVLNADYMCSTVKVNETCPVINSTEYPDIPKKKINNTDINTVLFKLKITEELKNIKFEESNSVLFECTVSKKKSRATWLKDGIRIQTSDVSCRRYICQSEENFHSLKIEKASLQDIGTYTVIIEDKLSSATLFKEEESSKPVSGPPMENKNEDGG
ncbi:TTN [Mytilus edulis]|uniref:TTN n=1 Tax=Mytilus edulis TaxID=6550 RepID=A0A8S3Q454_MYTED|nr:TTN [Mytilus edulis]